MEVQLNWCWITGWFVQIHFVNIIWDISAHHLHRSNLNLSYKIFWIAHKSLENGYHIPKGYDIILWLENVSWIVTLPFYRSKISSTHASNFWKGCNLSCSAALTLKRSPRYAFFPFFSSQLFMKYQDFSCVLLCLLKLLFIGALCGLCFTHKKTLEPIPSVPQNFPNSSQCHENSDFGWITSRAQLAPARYLNELTRLGLIS